MSKKLFRFWDWIGLAILSVVAFAIAVVLFAIKIALTILIILYVLFFFGFQTGAYLPWVP